MPLKLQARMVSLISLHQINVTLPIAIGTTRSIFDNYLLGMKFKFFPNECQRERRKEILCLGQYLQKMKISIF